MGVKWGLYRMSFKCQERIHWFLQFTRRLPDWAKKMEMRGGGEVEKKS